MFKLLKVCTFVLIFANIFQASTFAQGRPPTDEEVRRLHQEEINQMPSRDDPRHPLNWTPEERWDMYQGRGVWGDW